MSPTSVEEVAGSAGVGVYVGVVGVAEGVATGVGVAEGVATGVGVAEGVGDAIGKISAAVGAFWSV